MKHIKERKNLQREFEKDKDLKPKASTELWTLRKTEKTLAAQKRFDFFRSTSRYRSSRFKEAQEAKNSADALVY